MFALAVGKVKFKLYGGQCSVPVYLSNNVIGNMILYAKTSTEHIA